MYKFIIQKIGEEISSDSATLIESINYQKFIGNNNYEYMVVKDLNDFKGNCERTIPIGTIEFVEEFIKKYNLKSNNFKPIHINNSFTKNQKVTQSKIDIVNALTYSEEVFIKPFDKFKSDFSDKYGYIFNKSNLDLFVDGNKYFISKILDIVSEYRVFIFFDNIKGIYNYSGSFTEFLTEEDLKTIKEMINEIKVEGLNAYTLDIGILSNRKIQLLEIHPFFSCGLYGFSDYKILPQMYINGFKFLTK